MQATLTDTTDTIEDIKLKLFTKTNIPFTQQILKANEKELENYFKIKYHPTDPNYGCDIYLSRKQIEQHQKLSDKVYNELSIPWKIIYQLKKISVDELNLRNDMDQHTLHSISQILIM